MKTIGALSQVEAELVVRCQAGDETAWVEFVERYSRYVHAIIRRGFQLREEDAEEVFQEVFVRVYRRLGELRDPAAVRGWIASLTRNLAVDRLRAAPPENENLEDVDPVTLDRELELIDEAMAVHDALLALPEPYAEVLDRFFARDESYRTIGEALGLPPGTIASRISRGLALLREQLGDSGW